MYQIRKTKTGSGKTAIQVVEYRGGKTLVVKHFGSAANQGEVIKIAQTAREWINRQTNQAELFDCTSPSSTWIETSKLIHLRSQPLLLYRVLSEKISLVGFDKVINQICHDLVIMRLVEPSSKLQSLALLKEYFGISHPKNSMYQSILDLKQLQTKIESAAVTFVKERLHFDFSLVFYDVTTLYFESFKSDEDELDSNQKLIAKGLRKCGFSKDNKFNQPQIVIGLMVNHQGFPLSVQVFSGNTFEGHTFLSSVLRLKRKYHLDQLTVVADAAMISKINIDYLAGQGLNYIVGARMGNLSLATIIQIHQQLTDHQGGGIDGKTTRLVTDKGNLICSYSKKRYHKDRSQMEKQIKKAKSLIQQPGKATKRAKFITQSHTGSMKLNSQLMNKTKLLLGIKGYYSNLSQKTDQEVINHYHDLWQVEKAFRIAKTDLQMRPLYHRKKSAIKGHIVLCFMALCVAKHLEQTIGISIHKIIHQLKGITDSYIQYQTTGEVIRLKKQLTEKETQLLAQLDSTY